jgi:hypothetical protein
LTAAPIFRRKNDEVEQMLALHRLYVETEYHQERRANF